MINGTKERIELSSWRAAGAQCKMVNGNGEW